MSHKEIKQRLLKAETMEEAAKIARESGIELSTEEAEHLFAEIQLQKQAAAEDQAISKDELESISGGKMNLGKLCKNTVEVSSVTYYAGKVVEARIQDWCWFSVDYCGHWTETYNDAPFTVT